MAPLTEPAFARLRSVDPVLAEAAGDAAFELETDLFAALAKGIMEKGASDAFPFAWASLAAQIGEVSPERVLEAGSALEAFGKKTANALLGAAKAVRSGKIGMERLAALPDDEAVGAFAGRVLVRHGAQKTTSQETNQNLVATKTARMYTQPMLEIYADDVKCAHGSTIGQLNDAALFYMQQRGISQKEAKLLLEFAFINEVIDKMDLEPLRDRLFLVEKRFRGELSKCVGCKMCQ